MTAIFQLPRVRVTDANGNAVPGAKAYFYAAGTSNARTVYQDRTLATPHTQPVVADASGVLAPIYPDPTSGPYKVDIKTAAGTSLPGYPVDNIEGPFDETALSVLYAKPLRPVTAKTSNFTVADADMGAHYECDTTSGDILATLPNAASVNTKIVSFRKTITAGTVTVKSVSGQSIVGAASSGTSYQITARGATVTLFSTGTAWVAIEVTPLTDGLITAAMLSGSLSGAFLQTGSVIPWMHATIPSNYLECNGALINRTTYAGLFSVLGTTYGVGDGSTTFGIPDLRGMFLRGQNNGRAGAFRDPDAASRGDRGDGTTADNVGTTQAGAAQAHTHTGTTDSNGAHTHSYGNAGGTQTVGSDGSGATLANSASGTTGSNGAHTHAFTTDASSGSETRPNNVAVKWIIFTGGAGAGVTYAPMLRHGSGSPSDSVGSDDDFYLDVDRWKYYGPKAGGTWSGTGTQAALHIGFSYQYSSTTTDADPGAGIFRLNNASPASATQIFLSELDLDATNIAAPIAAWFGYGSTSARGTLRLVKYGDQSNFADYTVTGSLTDAGNYDKASLIYISGSGTFTDGDTLALMFVGAGPAGATGGTGATGANGTDPGLRWLFDDGTSMADPGSGDLRLNNATPASVTAIALSHTTAETGNPSASGWIATFDVSSSAIKGTLTVKKASAPQNFAVYDITARGDNGTWSQLTVTYKAGSGTFTLADNLSVQFDRTGDAGSGAVSSVFGLSGAVTIPSLTDEPSLDKADSFAFYDASAAAHREGTVDNLFKSQTTLTALTAPAIDDEVSTYDLSATAARKIQWQNALKVVDGLTEKTAPVAGDFLLVYDTAGTAAKKVNLKNVGAGKQIAVIPASAMIPRTTNGAAPGTVEMTTNKQMLKTLDFDGTTPEYAQFVIVRMPKSWNEGTVTYRAIWLHAATATNFGVTWALEAVAIGDDDALDVAWGTAVNQTDTGGTTNDVYHTAESSAVTIAGTPVEGDSVWFQVKRLPTDGSDTLAIDARLIGVALFFTTDQNTEV